MILIDILREKINELAEKKTYNWTKIDKQLYENYINYLPREEQQMRRDFLEESPNFILADKKERID